MSAAVIRRLALNDIILRVARGAPAAPARLRADACELLARALARGEGPMIPPLAIVQARMHSTRLPGKMLLHLGGKPLIQWAWEAAVEAFGEENVVVATPFTPENKPIGDWVCSVNGQGFGWEGPEWDVLGRFHAVAHAFRDDPGSVIVRITPDDFPIDTERERFTLGWLDERYATVVDPRFREHIGLLLPQRIEINTPEDYEAAKRQVGDA
jgi:hypothetical protein